MFDLLRRHANKIILDSCTVLHHACTGYPVEFVSHLLASMVNVNARDGNGRTPLMCAITAINCPLEVVQLLIKNGADVSAKSNTGNTACKCGLKPFCPNSTI